MRARPPSSVVDSALYRALHSVSGARDRWSRMPVDATDAAFEDAIAVEFHSEGGFSVDSASWWCWYSGGERPRLTLSQSANGARWKSSEHYTLSGRALIAETRRVLKRRAPDALAPAQGDLFG